MDDMGMIDLSQVEEKRKQSDSNENLGQDAQHGLGLGISLGKQGLAGLDALLLGAKNKISEKQGQVGRWVDVTPGVQAYSAQVRAIGQAMRPEWWAARAQDSPEKIGRELIGYAQERAERARRREEKASAPAPVSRPRPEREKEKTYSMEDLTRPGWLSGSPDARTLDVCRQTAGYMARPETRPAGEFPPVKIKDWAKLSDNSRVEYKKILTQTKREMKESGVRTTFDVVAYLSDKCKNLSRSRYNSVRGCLLQSAHMQGDTALTDAIRSMPPYVQLCRTLGKTPTPRQGEITRQRKQRKEANTWENLLNALPPHHADAVRLIRATGARVGECASIRLSRTGDGTITASIASSKTGSRKKGENVPTIRTISYTPGSPRYDVMADIYARRGEVPAPLSAPAIQGAYTRARKKVGEEASDGQIWTLHALRHAYARERKDEIFTKLKQEHGEGWRVKLYGDDWHEGSRKAYMEGVYGGLADELGHTCTTMAKKYG